MSLLVKDVLLGHFWTVTRQQGNELIVRMCGNADSQVRDVLESFLRQLDVESRRVNAETAVVDVRELFFMNSSCLSLMVRWISTLAESTMPYKIRFIANAGLRWQCRSLAPLAALAPSVVTVVSSAK
jgi:hypothetical protein